MFVVAEPKSGSKSRRRWRVTPRFWALAVAIFAVYMGVSYVSGFVQIWRMENEINRVRAEIEAIEAQNQQLREELAYLLSDEYVEKVAREELGLVMPGETAVIVTTSGGDSTGGASP